MLQYRWKPWICDFNIGVACYRNTTNDAVSHSIYCGRVTGATNTPSEKTTPTDTTYPLPFTSSLRGKSLRSEYINVFANLRYNRYGTSFSRSNLRLPTRVTGLLVMSQSRVSQRLYQSVTVTNRVSGKPPGRGSVTVIRPPP